MSTLRLACLVLLLGCGGSPSAAAPVTSPGATPSATESTGPREPPRLVVAIVLDQLPTHSLEHYLPHLPEEGAIRRGIAAGAFHHRVVYPFAGTYTAAGHAAIHTGAPPAVTGVVSNQVFDRDRQRDVPIVDDGRHAVHGAEGAFASPAVLRVDTVADALDRATGGRALAASLSLKDRGAIFGGGRRPDLVLWYDKSIPGFTTSTFYADALPEWLVAWQAEHPFEALLAPWEAGDPELLSRIAGRDDAPGEGSWHGFGTTFPHDPRQSESPYSVLRATPQSTEHLLALAQAAASELGLGEDAIPDLLSVSISATDYVAHVFGPHSWEYADNLIRTDRALAAFLDRLEREHGPLAVLLTSDHGGAPLPERAADGDAAGRFLPSEMARGVEGALDRELGRGDWVAAFVQPFLYLTAAAREDAVRDRAVTTARRWLTARSEIALAADAREAVGWRDSDDPVRRAVGLSIPDDPQGDLFVVPARGFVVDEDMPAGFGTSHGTPWEYDQTVPVVFWGPGVAHLETREPLAQGRVATTLAALLGIEPPSAAPTDPLPGAPGARNEAVMRQIEAVHDEGLSARMGACVPLAYDDGASEEEDRPAFVRAASALAWIGEEMAILQDDAAFIGVRGSAGEVRSVSLPRGPGGRRVFEERLGNKSDKLDLEAAVTLPGSTGPRLVAFGSGSLPARERVVVWEPQAEAAVRVLDASRLYARLRRAHAFAGSELNVEGAVVVGDTLRLFQRGNGAPAGELVPVNATVDLALDAFVEWLDAGAEGEPPALGAIRQYDLGSVRGVLWGFTDAAALGDDRIVFLVGAEDSPDAVRDGEVLGARIGVMDAAASRLRWTTLLDADGRPAVVKAEGILARPDRPDAVWVVLDPDDVDRPATLCEVLLAGPWRSG